MAAREKLRLTKNGLQNFSRKESKFYSLNTKLFNF